MLKHPESVAIKRNITYAQSSNFYQKKGLAAAKKKWPLEEKGNHDLIILKHIFIA
jgi:hypothetical protein